MKKIYFIIPAVILIIGTLPLLLFHSSSSKVTVIYAKIVKTEKTEFGINASYCIFMTVDNTGKAVAICYINSQGNTIPFNDIHVIYDSTLYGDSIPPGENNITILVNTNNLQPPLLIYLSNG